MWERLQSQPLDQSEVVQSCIEEANDEVSRYILGQTVDSVFGESFNVWRESNDYNYVIHRVVDDWEWLKMINIQRVWKVLQIFSFRLYLTYCSLVILQWSVYCFYPILNHLTTQMKISNILRRYSELKEGFGNIPTLTNQHSFKVSQFHKLLKNSYGKSLSKLQVCLYEKILQKKFFSIFKQNWFLLFPEHVSQFSK